MIREHLQGKQTIGVYPLLPDDTCRFLAVNFDKTTWQEDVAAFRETCSFLDIPVAVERSRSGNGAHVWFFFTEPVMSTVARVMGCFLITETMSRRHQLSMESYDRLFSRQDTMTRGGFGNLIALPLQLEPRKQENAVFVDEAFVPYVTRVSSELAGVKSTKELEEVDFEKNPANKIIVAEPLVSPHRLVSLMSEKLYGRKNNISADPDRWLDSGSFISVTTGTADRALRIADTLIKALDARGYQLCIEKGHHLSHVTVLNEQISISIQETTKQVPHKPTPEEVRQKKQHSWMTYHKYDYVKSGELIIKLTSGTSQSTISDKIGKPLELQLNDVIIRMLRLSVRLHNNRLEEEQRARELEERRKRHNELVQLHEQEKAKLEKLYTDSSQWHKSQKSRSYIEAVRQKAVQADGKILPGSEHDDWIKWAHQQADRMDPLVESPHSILDEKIPTLWNWP